MDGYEKRREIVRRLTPMAYSFFEKLMEDALVCEETLRVILDDPQLRVSRVVQQKSIKNLYGRSVRLDAYCILGDGRHVNIEVQKSDEDNHLKRVRYNASCITANVSEPGERFEQIRDVYMVYISSFDVFGRERTIYHVEPTIIETGEAVDNGLHEIYVNTKIDDGSTVAELMSCFKAEVVRNGKFPRLSQKTMYFKSEEGVKRMCKLIEDYAKEYAKDYVKEYAKEYAEEYAKGYAEERVCEMARWMIQDECSNEMIGKYTKLPEERIDQLREEIRRMA